MTHEDYRAALEAAIKEYEQLGAERRDIDDRLAQLAQTITTLSKLLGLAPTVPMGLTDACRLVYRNARVPLAPTEVRDRLASIGFDLSVYSNEMAAIHTVLKRLHESGELKSIAAPAPATGYARLYVWRQPTTAIAIGPELAEVIRGQKHFHTDEPERPRAQRRRKR
jgi:hypothetical protein